MRGRARLGVQAFADGLLVIPKTLARNSGFDAQDTIVKLQEESQVTGEHVGLDVSTGEAILPADEGILDNYCVKRQLLMSWYEHRYNDMRIGSCTRLFLCTQHIMPVCALRL